MIGTRIISPIVVPLLLVMCQAPAPVIPLPSRVYVPSPHVEQRPEPSLDVRIDKAQRAIQKALDGSDKRQAEWNK